MIKKAKPMLECDFCGGPFKQTRKDRRFCTTKCKADWHNDARKNAFDNYRKNNNV